MHPPASVAIRVLHTLIGLKYHVTLRSEGHPFIETVRTSRIRSTQPLNRLSHALITVADYNALQCGLWRN